MTKQQLINDLTNQLHAKNMEVLELRRRLTKAEEVIKDRNNEEIVKIVYAWGQSTESFSKAILALKGCL